jgi:hypothetical protein
MMRNTATACSGLVITINLSPHDEEYRHSLQQPSDHYKPLSYDEEYRHFLLSDDSLMLCFQN